MGNRKKGKSDEKRNRRKEAKIQPENPGGIGGSIAALAEEVTKSPPTGSNATTKTERAENPWKRTWDWFTRGSRPFAIVVAVSTAINVAVAFYQWRAMLHQNELMVELAWLENRPWLDIKGPVEITNFAAGEKVACKFKLTNTGKSAGIITEWVVSVDTMPSNGATGLELDGIQFLHPSSLARRNTVPPASENEMLAPRTPTLSAKEIKEIENGSTFLYMGVKIVYLDGASKEHRTFLVLTYDATRKRMVGRQNHHYMD